MDKIDIKMKFFLKPKYDDDIDDIDHYGYGGMYIGDGTEYPIRSIHFGNKTVEVYRAPSCAGEVIWGSVFGYGGITDIYSFDQLEIVNIDFIKSNMLPEEFDKINEKTQYQSDEQWKKIKSGYYAELRQQQKEAEIEAGCNR